MNFAQWLARTFSISDNARMHHATPWSGWTSFVSHFAHPTSSLPDLFRQSSIGDMREKGGYVYILASKRNGTLYTGVTSDLSGRVWEHREGILDGFTKRYGVKMLVWHEAFDDIRAAIQKERTIKKYPRAWKINLIEDINAEWRDLYDDIVW